jgi:hypothetical protein
VFQQFGCSRYGVDNGPPRVDTISLAFWRLGATNRLPGWALGFLHALTLEELVDYWVCFCCDVCIPAGMAVRTERASPGREGPLHRWYRSRRRYVLQERRRFRICVVNDRICVDCVCTHVFVFGARFGEWELIPLFPLLMNLLSERFSTY